MFSYSLSKYEGFFPSPLHFSIRYTGTCPPSIFRFRRHRKEYFSCWTLLDDLISQLTSIIPVSIPRNPCNQLIPFGELVALMWQNVVPNFQDQPTASSKWFIPSMHEASLSLCICVHHGQDVFVALREAKLKSKKACFPGKGSRQAGIGSPSRLLDTSQAAKVRGFMTCKKSMLLLENSLHNTPVNGFYCSFVTGWSAEQQPKSWTFPPSQHTHAHTHLLYSVISLTESFFPL